MAETLTDKTFQFELVSPERVLVSEQARMVVVPGDDGDFGVLAGHTPLLSSIRPGVVTVTAPSGEQRRIFVAGGFADVNGAVCSVLAEDAADVKDLDRAELEEQLKSLADDQGFAGDDEAKKSRIARDIEMTKAKLAAVA